MSKKERILGVDPGLKTTGWGIIDVDGSNLSYVASGVIETNAKESLPLRLCDLQNGLKEILAKYNPQKGAIEETFVNKNAQSSLKLGHARGALIVTMADFGIVPAEYSPNLIKKS